MTQDNRWYVDDVGYIELLDIMGDDWEPVRAARVSHDQGLKGESQDTKLLNYLMVHGHTSPLEMVEVKFEVYAPLVVARQWVRHRTANWNEVSYRYTELDPPVFYKPAAWRAQDTKNKQGSDGLIENQEEADNLYNAACEGAAMDYRALLDLGVSREMARMVLPVSVYTKWMWKNDLHNTLHFLKLRLGEGASWEIRQYAEGMLWLLEQKLPVLMGLARPLLL